MAWTAGNAGGEPTPSELLDITVDRNGTTTVLTVRGEIDLYTAPLLRTAVAQAVDRTSELVVIDLAEVTFMASSGLSVLVAALDKAGARHCRLRLAGGGRAVHRPLRMAGLYDRFDHYPSAADAADRWDVRSIS